MKAVVMTKFGPPEGLQLQEVAKPAPKDSASLKRTDDVGMELTANSGPVSIVGEQRKSIRQKACVPWSTK